MHFFISYAKADTYELADKLYNILNGLPGITAWMDHDLISGTDWAGQIQHEIDLCDQMIVLLSLDVNRKPTQQKGASFVLKEIHYAQQERKPIIPIMAQETRLPVQIAGIEYIDFRQNHDTGMQRLLREIDVKMGNAEQLPVEEVTSQPRTMTTVKTSSRRYVPVIGILVVLAIIITGLALTSGNAGNPTPTLSSFNKLQTSEAQATQSRQGQINNDNTATVEAVANANATSTAQQLQATETLAQATLIALSATLTRTPVPPTATLSPSNTPTHTLTPTFTPSNTPTLTFTLTLSPEYIAKTPVTANANWTPIEQDFDGVTMVLVPVGQFEMGSTEEQIDHALELCQQAADNGAECQRSWYEDEAPNGDNTQVFTEPLWIDKYEVSRTQYQACVDATICTETPDSSYSSEPDQPINRVTWFQAKEYCESRDARLPTEAEWEYVARGPDGLLFPWGNDFTGNEANHCDRNCGEQDWASDYNYVNQENDDGYAIMAPVTAYEQGESWVGARNMAGNVWEWTSSLSEDYPYSTNSEIDINNSDLRVVRGGSFDNSVSNLRSAFRGWDLPDYNINYGFRCVRS